MVTIHRNRFTDLIQQGVPAILLQQLDTGWNQIRTLSGLPSPHQESGTAHRLHGAALRNSHPLRSYEICTLRVPVHQPAPEILANSEAFR
jgi:hypothetical protein